MSNVEPERFQFTSADGLSIACVKWSGHHDARAVVQIAHRLGEHMGRYAELAETLVHGEFVVYVNDYRGHGLTAKPTGNFGDFGPGGLSARRGLWFLLKLMNAPFEPARTPVDWLSRDKAEVDAVINDPLCFRHLTRDR